jgi:diguanylate cyclase (GGDEF)-like protein
LQLQGKRVVDDATRIESEGVTLKKGSGEARSPERSAALAGRVRIALGLLGLFASAFVAPAPPGWAFFAYLTIALAFQWMIQRRRFRSVTRAVIMGLVDMLFLSFCVQRVGSISSPLALVYVVVPVLYATTTPRRRISMVIAIVGTLSYALVVLLEQLELLAYAGSARIARPDVATALVYVLLVALCTSVTAAMTSQLISALGKANARLRDLSQHDELTGLYNRRYLMQRLQDELARNKRKPGILTVAMVDLDGFKRVNDQEGHDAGDAVLKAVAGALLSATRRADVVARYGGDEFVVLLPDTEAEGARTVGARILDQGRSAALRVCPAIPVSVSIGTTAVRPADDPTEVIRRVDEQLYAAKRAGGDRIYSA